MKRRTLLRVGAMLVLAALFAAQAPAVPASAPGGALLEAAEGTGPGEESAGPTSPMAAPGRGSMAVRVAPAVPPQEGASSPRRSRLPNSRDPPLVRVIR
jgi:hypothetical protein